LNESEVSVFVNKIKGIDEIMIESAQRILGKNYKKYKYSTIYREPLEDDENEESAKKYKSPPYINVKLDLEWGTNKLLTKVFESYTENNKKCRDKLDTINSIDDLTTILKYMSRFRAVIKPIKVWAASPKSKDLEWGIAFKLVRVEIERGTGNIKSQNNNDEFIDSDDDELDKLLTNTKISDNNKKDPEDQKENQIENNDKNNANNDNEEDNEKDNEEDNEKDNEEDDEDNAEDNDDNEEDDEKDNEDDDEDNNNKNDDDDDEDEDDEEEEQKVQPIKIEPVKIDKKIPKNNTKLKKIVEVDSSDDEVEIKKPVDKKTKSKK